MMETKFVEKKSLKGVNLDSEDDFKETLDKKKTTTFDFTEKTWKDDFVLIVENERLHVAKIILAHASPVFDTMFKAEFQEKNSSELELPGKKVEDVKTFLRCIYPDSVEVNSENVSAVLPLAEEYQVSNLKLKCEAVLLRQVKDTISSDDLYIVIEQASLYNMPDLLKYCVDIASDMDVKSFRRAERKGTFSQDLKYMILDKMVTRLQHKNLLEVLKRYYETIVETDQILDITDYDDWDGCSHDITIPLDKWSLFEVSLHGMKAQSTIKIGACDSSRFGIKGSTKSVEKMAVFGRIAIQHNSEAHKVLSKQIKFECNPKIGKEIHIPDFRCGIDFAKKNFIYHGKVKVNIHILAKLLKK